MSNLATITNNILADSGIDDINVVVTNGSYANPAWITSLAWSKITGAPLGDYLPLVGGTMTGPLILAPNLWYESSPSQYALNLQNSDIIGMNALYFNDLTDGNAEGINWYNTASSWDTLYSKSGVLYYNPNRTTGTAGTEYVIWTAQNLVNPVTGTGTVNYLPKWTSGSAIGNSVITDNGTTVGINDASANNSIVAIKGNWVSGYATVKTYPITAIASGGASGYGIFDSDGNTRLAFFAVNSGAVEVWGQQNTSMHFATNNSIKMVLTTGGILGVNTLTPTSVAGGGIEIFEDTNGGTLSLSRDAGNQRGILRFGRNNGGTFQTAARIIGDSDGGTGANGSLYFQVSNSSSALINALQIASTGASTFISSVTATSFVKVGGTSAQYLKADGSVSTLTNPVTGTGVTQGVAYWTSTSEISSESDFAYEASNNRVRINSNAWDSAGAEAKLIVSGVLSAGSSATVQINGFVRIKDQLLIHNGANTAQDAYIQAVGQGVLTVGNKLLINTTTIDSYQLDVRSTASDVARFVAASGDALVRIIANNYGTEADARLFLGENDTLGMTFEYDGQNNIGHIGMNDSVDPTGAFSRRISMPRAGTDTIFGAGNVLIGTSSPNGATLQVSGRGTINAASTDYALTLQNVQDDAQGLLVRATDNDGSLYLIRAQSSNSSVSQTWVDRFTLAKNGTATFSGILQVRSTASTPSIWSGSFGGAISILGDNATSNRYIDLSIVDSTGALATQGIRLVNSGNVLIGTTTDYNQKLLVNGNVQVTASNAFRASYNNTDSYHGALTWATLQLGNNGGNRIIGGRTATGGALQFYVNTTNDCTNYATVPDGVLAMTMASSGRIGMGTTNPTALYNIGLEIYDNTGGGTLSLSRDAGNQRGILRFGRNNGGAFQEAARVVGSSDVGTGANGYLYLQTTNSSGTMLDRMIIFPNNRVAINDSSANGILQVSGSHVGGYGMLNMNSVDSCIIAMDSSTSWDVRLRYKFQGVDYWFAGMVTDNTWRLTKGDNTAVLYATQGNNVYIPNGGLQIASEGGFTGSAKFLVGSFLSSGSSAIMQVNGFIRMRDQLIIHRDSNTAQETYLQCTGSNALTTGGSITATSFFESSDARLKSNINDLSIDVSSIKAKIYEKDGKTEIGYLAQDVENILSGAVSKRDNGYLDLSYRQVHTAKIAALEAKIKELELQLKNK